QELRDFSCHGYRELMCFLYRNFAMQSLLIGDSPKDAAKEAQRMMLEFNQRFKKPLIEKNVESKTRNIERKQYNFKNETIITMLNIKDHEQRELKTIIDDNEYMRRQREYDKRRDEIRKEKRKKARRNEQGLTKKQAELKELKIKIIELREQKLSYREIASKLNVSLGKVQRALKCNY
ncbi:helix-turn-helix domain-containing protein, partial [Tepidibacter formicigenes]